MFEWLSQNGLGLIGAGVSAYNTKKTNEVNQAIAEATNQANERMNQANIEYQRELNQQIFDREDTSYQRTVSDMIKAGLSPSMLSSTNGAGGTVSAPANTFGAVGSTAQANNVGEILSSIDGLLDMKMKQAQINNINADTQYKNPATKYLSILESLADSLQPDSSARKQVDKIVGYIKSQVKPFSQVMSEGIDSFTNMFNEQIYIPLKELLDKSDLPKTVKSKVESIIEDVTETKDNFFKKHESKKTESKKPYISDKEMKKAQDKGWKEAKRRIKERKKAERKQASEEYWSKQPYLGGYL